MMKLKNFLSYVWKLPLCGIAFFVGMALGDSGLARLGFVSPALPAGTDEGTIALWFLFSSIALAALLSPSARRLQAGWLARWLFLSLFVWIFAAVGMVLEAFFFMSTDAVSSLQNALFTVFNFLLPSVFLCGAVVSLFRPATITAPSLVFAAQGWKDWLWRAGAALLAYPLIYFAFGLLVQPLISDYYTTGQYELVVPTWGQMLPLQMGRSLLFLLVCLPLIARWGGSRRALWLSLGSAIFACTAFMAVLTAYWFPWQMRLFHGLELLVDGMLYAGALTWLLTRQPIRENSPDWLSEARQSSV